MLKKIPVAMLTYNRSKTAIKSIKSIMDDVDIKDLVIFDDGSDFEELSNIKTFCSHYSNIKIYENKKNMGYQYNLIKALTYLSKLDEELVFLCESDMLLVKNWSTYVFDAFGSSPKSIALSAMLHYDQLTKNRSKFFRERCLTGYDPRFPRTGTRIPLGEQSFEDMPDEQEYIKLSKGTIKYISNSVGSIVFKSEFLKKIIPFLGELYKFPEQEDAWLVHMCFKVNNYNAKSFMVLDPGIAFTFGENGLHGSMVLCNLRWQGSIFWRQPLIAMLSKKVLYLIYVVQKIPKKGVGYVKKKYLS